MTYFGGSLKYLYEPEPTKRALRKMTDSGGDNLHDLIVRNTPIDSGNLRTSWYRLRTKQRPTPVGMVYESKIATDVSYAPYVENGTGLWGPKHAKYVIRPKTAGALSWLARDSFGGKVGGRVFAQVVHHPGSPGAHMIANACAKAEANFDQPLKQDMATWAREMEQLDKLAMSRGLVKVHGRL